MDVGGFPPIPFVQSASLMGGKTLERHWKDIGKTLERFKLSRFFQWQQNTSFVKMGDNVDGVMEAMEHMHMTFYSMIQANSVFFHYCRQPNMLQSQDFLEAHLEAIRTESNFWAAHHVYVQERIRQEFANMDRARENESKMNDFV